MIANLRSTATILLVLTALPVWAGQNDSRYSGSNYNNDQYDYAKVVAVQPVTEIVQIPDERQVCRQVPVQNRVVAYRSPAPVVLGAIVGGVIGNQLSRGRGHDRGHGRRHGYRQHNNRAAATIAGAAAAVTAIGNITIARQRLSQVPQLAVPLPQGFNIESTQHSITPGSHRYAIRKPVGTVRKESLPGMSAGNTEARFTKVEWMSLRVSAFV